jgi:cytochrome bd ubiquinol oxidase subunit I
VYGLMRTSDGTSPVVSAPEILLSILMFGSIYLLLGVLWLFLLRREIVHGPEQEPVPAQAPGEQAVVPAVPRTLEVH